MYQNVKRTCRVLFGLINAIVLWRSRCRRRRRCLSSLLSPRQRKPCLNGPEIIIKDKFNEGEFQLRVTETKEALSLWLKI